MEGVLRAASIYLLLLLFFRMTGKRSLAEITSFDFVLLLIISEATQPALVGRDNSVVNSVVVILTLMSVDNVLSFLKQRWPRFEKIIDDTPLIVVKDGKPLKDRMKKERIDEGDILTAARRLRGLGRLEEIKYAVLERNGGITIIPVREQTEFNS